MGIDTPDLFVLTNGRMVTRFVGREVKWKWNSEDQTSLVIYTYILLTPQAVYAIGLSKSFATRSLLPRYHPKLGKSTSALIPSSIGTVDDVLYMVSSSGDPFVIWLESNQIESRWISNPNRLRTEEGISDVGLASHGLFMVTKLDGDDRVMKIVRDEVQVAWHFEGSAASENQSTSKYAGGFDKEGRAYIGIGRINWVLHQQNFSLPILVMVKASLQDALSSLIQINMGLLWTQQIQAHIRSSDDSLPLRVRFNYGNKISYNGLEMKGYRILPLLNSLNFLK